MHDTMEEESTPKSTTVERPLHVDVDLGNLLLSDTNEIAVKSLRANPDEYLRTLARDNAQLLINEIWKLPFERVDDVIITKLPKATYILPREKPAPKAKTLTKWESYAKEKGITKRKKTKLVWDELVKKWVPRFGYKKVDAEAEKDWVLEVPGNVDPMEDQFERKSEAKAERVSKNELQRLRNLAKAKKVDIPGGSGLTSKEKPSKIELHQAVHVAKKATASLGKFQAKLPKEKPLKGTGKKRQFEPLVIDSTKEKNKNLDVLARVMSKKPKIDIASAVNKQVDIREMEKSSFRSKSHGPKQGSGGGRSGSKRSDGKRRSGPGKPTAGRPRTGDGEGMRRGRSGGARGGGRNGPATGRSAFGGAKSGPGGGGARGGRGGGRGGGGRRGRS